MAKRVSSLLTEYGTHSVFNVKEEMVYELGLVRPRKIRRKRTKSRSQNKNMDQCELEPSLERRW
jgi:hypothetical protein